MDKLIESCRHGRQPIGNAPNGIERTRAQRAACPRRAWAPASASAAAREMAAAVAFYRDRPRVRRAPPRRRIRCDDRPRRCGGASLGVRRLRPGESALTSRSGLCAPAQKRSFAGTASCRIMTDGVDEAYAELRSQGVLHPVSQDGVERPTSGRGNSPRSTPTGTCSRSSTGWNSVTTPRARLRSIQGCGIAG